MNIVLRVVQSIIFIWLCRATLSIKYMRQDKEDDRERISQNYEHSQNIVPYFTGIAADLPT